MKFFSLFIALFFMTNESFSQYVYIKGYGGGDRQIPSLIIAKYHSDVESLVDSNSLKDKFIKELILLEDKREYERIAAFIKNYRSAKEGSSRSMFFIEIASKSGNIEYSINGEYMPNFLEGLQKCLKKSSRYTDIRHVYERYQDRVLNSNTIR